MPTPTGIRTPDKIVLNFWISYKVFSFRDCNAIFSSLSLIIFPIILWSPVEEISSLCWNSISKLHWARVLGTFQAFFYAVREGKLYLKMILKIRILKWKLSSFVPEYGHKLLPDSIFPKMGSLQGPLSPLAEKIGVQKSSKLDVRFTSLFVDVSFCF